MRPRIWRRGSGVTRKSGRKAYATQISGAAVAWTAFVEHNHSLSGDLEMFDRNRFGLAAATRWFAAAGVAFALVAPAAVSAADYRLGHVYPTESVIGQAATRFADLVRERTNGEINIKLFPSGQLGGDEQMGRDLSRGLLDFSLLNHGSAVALDKRLDMLALPFVATTPEQVDKIYYGDGVVPTTSREAFTKLNIHFLGWFESEFRAVANSKRPIKALADLRGLKIRVPPARGLRMFFDDAGAQTVIMPFPELFTALQQRTVDGQENGPILTLASKLYESTKYLTLTNHVFSHGAILASQTAWARFTPQQREVLERTGKEVQREQIEKQRAVYRDSVARLRAAGVEVIELPDAARKEMQQVGMGVWEKMADTYGADKIAQLRKEVMATQK